MMKYDKIITFHHISSRFIILISLKKGPKSIITIPKTFPKIVQTSVQQALVDPNHHSQTGVHVFGWCPPSSPYSYLKIH